MKRLSLALLLCLALAPLCARSQDFAAAVRTMTTAYAASGSIVAVDARTILIEPSMPAPLCAVPRNADGKVTWSYYAFPLASITVPLASIDETLIGEDTVFTDPGAAKVYKPGESAGATMITIAGLPGKQFHTLAYDRDKFLRLGPGPHSAAEYGEAPDDTEVFALTFADRSDADAFAAALRRAVALARAQVAQR